MEQWHQDSGISVFMFVFDIFNKISIKCKNQRCTDKREVVNDVAEVVNNTPKVEAELGGPESAFCVTIEYNWIRFLLRA